MLENYYYQSGSQTTPEKKRLIAVQAALEIIKTSASASTADSNNSKLRWDIEYATASLDTLADAIQESLKVK